MSDLIGRKVKGWKFEGRTDDIIYLSEMNNFIGKEGVIVKHDNVRVLVRFDTRFFGYPLSQVHDHLIPTKVEQMYNEVEAKLNTPEYYDNTNGSIYKFCNDQGLNAYESDLVKRIVRCRKKGEFKSDLEKTKVLIDLYLKEYEG